MERPTIEELIEIEGKFIQEKTDFKDVDWFISMSLANPATDKHALLATLRHFYAMRIYGQVADPIWYCSKKMLDKYQPQVDVYF